MTATCRDANPCRHRRRECPGGVGRRGCCVGDPGPTTRLPLSHFWKKITSVNIFVVFIGACQRSLILVPLTFTWHSVLNDTSHFLIFHWHFPLVYLLHPQQGFLVQIVVEYFWKAFTPGRWHTTWDEFLGMTWFTLCPLLAVLLDLKECDCDNIMCECINAFMSPRVENMIA